MKSQAEGGVDAAANALDHLAAKGADTAVVADVNGLPVSRRALNVLAAASVMNGGTDASGRPLAQLSRRELLDGIVDSILLAQAAEAAGVVVTDDDVSLMVKK